MDKEKTQPNNIGYYNKDTERVIQEQKVHCQTHHQTFQDMSIHQLKVIGANTRTLVWEYLSANMDYENEIHPVINDMAEEIDMNRVNVSKAINYLVQNYCLMQIGGSKKGRTGRKFMVNPHYRNRGSSKDIHRKKERWDVLWKENDAAYKAHIEKRDAEDRKFKEEEKQLETAAFFKRNPPPAPSQDNTPDDPMPF